MDAPPLVLVVWEDAKCLDTGPWADNGKVSYEPHIFHQVGYLLHSDERGVILTAVYHPETVGPRDQIPLGMIRSMTLLQAAPAPRTRKRK